MEDKKYRCLICGYIYDPTEGDDGQDIVKGTPFDQLPEVWKCPKCRVTKNYFEEVDDIFVPLM